jgi:hypothetical protein
MMRSPAGQWRYSASLSVPGRYPRETLSRRSDHPRRCSSNMIRGRSQSVDCCDMVSSDFCWPRDMAHTLSHNVTTSAS